MQIAIQVPQSRMSHGPSARLCSLVAGMALVALGLGTAFAIAPSPAGDALQRSGAALSQVGASVPLQMPNGAPGDTAVSYTTVAHGGAGAVTVRLYGSVRGTLAPHLAVTIASGAGGRGSWIADPGPPVYSGTLDRMPTDWNSGLGGSDVWKTGEQRDYRIEVTLLDHPAAQGSSAGASFRWEARSAP